MDVNGMLFGVAVDLIPVADGLRDPKREAAEKVL